MPTELILMPFRLNVTFLCCIVHYTQCPGQSCAVSKQPKPIEPNKHERKEKAHIAKDPLGCSESLLKYWEAEDESTACLHLTNKASGILLAINTLFSCKQK